ncbi:redoxin domain-containing protein [Nocardia sp. SYP-A9097]|uniref:peroxiredoxin family protein n=1 Tax=Nocardia sp. SYP-A9097 TaxID=2663237 RepID=UPI00129B7048|nr:peroxiredoxin family protein [Nocardia sp. SYP-A9097]MRH89211.1 redoxin domain-containing protein [Nocardia sp. SYP-A9097]
MLTSGSRAPRMEFEDTAGQVWRLSDYRGTHSVLLYFMRSTSCPICNRHVRDLIARQNEFADNNIQVCVAVPEDRETGAAWKTRHDIPFRVLVGASARPHESIGLSRKLFGTMQQSGTLLVDPDGIVRHAHGGTLPVNSYDRKGIIAAIHSIQAGRATA